MARPKQTSSSPTMTEKGKPRQRALQRIGKRDMEKACQYAREGNNGMCIRHLVALEIQSKYSDGWCATPTAFLEKLLNVAERVESYGGDSGKAGVTNKYTASLIEQWVDQQVDAEVASDAKAE